jgi:replication factor A1
MINLSYEEIITKIKEKSGMSEEELKTKIDGKLTQLSGLISKEGAAHIIASELGIKLIDKVSGRLQIKNILTGMRDVESVGKVASIFELRQFNSKGREGKVSSLLMADETDNVRVVMWNEQADSISKVKVGDVIKLSGAYVKDRNGSKELHLNDRSLLSINPPGEKVDVDVSSIQQQEQEQQSTPSRKKLSELSENDSMAEVLGTIVQVFDIKFFEVCPECGKRARQSDSGFSCGQHTSTEPSFSYVMNTVIDDGSENMRLVLFRQMAEKLLKKNEQEVLAYKAQPETFEQAKTDLLGEFVKAVVRVNKNDLFDRLELIAREVTEANPEEEMARLKAETK